MNMITNTRFKDNDTVRACEKCNFAERNDEVAVIISLRAST